MGRWRGEGGGDLSHSKGRKKFMRQYIISSGPQFLLCRLRFAVCSYNDVFNFYWCVLITSNLDVFLSLLLAPVIAGAQALSWAAGKLETNGIGLPTSPSSLSAIQTRVLQAAAKHESQSSETEETLNPSSQTMSPASENLDLSEA